MDRGASPRGFEVGASRTDGQLLLRLTGEFDLAGVPSFERELERMEDGTRTLVLDLRDVTFMDSSGLRAIVIADQQARAEGRRCVVVRGPEQVDHVLDLTGIGERLELVDQPPGAPAARGRRSGLG
jgi:anti-anti-sigma factor